MFRHPLRGIQDLLRQDPSVCRYNDDIGLSHPQRLRNSSLPLIFAGCSTGMPSSSGLFLHRGELDLLPPVLRDPVGSPRLDLMTCVIERLQAGTAKSGVPI